MEIIYKTFLSILLLYFLTIYFVLSNKRFYIFKITSHFLIHIIEEFLLLYFYQGQSGSLSTWNELVVVKCLLVLLINDNFIIFLFS